VQYYHGAAAVILYVDNPKPEPVICSYFHQGNA